MPKIRLSALATDMKGKAGGSVFSTNAGGVYFRNNPSGTSSKKPANGLRKQMFATLAQSWKLLSAEEMQAWADAGILYPTTNAWGETRIPKGFELYMRLNMNLRAAGVEPLTLPVTPRAIPSVLSAVIKWTDEFQLIPTSFFACQSIIDTSVYYHPTINSYLDSEDLSADRYFSFRTNIRPTQKGSPFNPSSITLFQIASSTNNGMFMYLEDLLTTEPFLYVSFETTTGSLVRQYPVLQSMLDTDFHIGYQLVEGDLEDGILYINGEAQTPSDTIDGTLTFDSLEANLVLFPSTNEEGYQILYSDFRIYNLLLAASRASEISYGYVFNNEYIYIPMNTYKDYQFVNYTTAGDDQPLTLTSAPPIGAVIFPYNPRLLPNITIAMNGTLETGYKLKFLCTQFVSLGKSFISNTFKLADTKDWTDAEVYNPQSGMSKLLYSTTDNGALMFKIQAVDITSGELGVDIICVPDPPRRRCSFKVGAEQAGKVN